MKKLIASAILAAAGTAFGAAILVADASAHENHGPGPMMAPGYGHGPGMMMEPGCGYGQGYGAGSMMGFEHPPMYSYRYEMLLIDQDHDGIVSEDEAAARHERIFGILDGDDDGSLTEDEFVYAPTGVRPGMSANDPRWQRRHQHRHERFESLDKNDDDKIGQAEFMAAGAERLAAADLNGDGKVTVWEFRSRRRAN